MGIKDLLVAVDNTPSNKPRLELATWLAGRFGAHLVGLHPSSIAQSGAYGASFDTSLFDAALQETVERAERRAAEAHSGFEAITARNGVSAEWRIARGFPNPETVLHARYVDLAILGQRWSDYDALSYPDPADVVLASGRPVLVVPRAGRFEQIERHALVAWNASREAARAVNDALPLLSLVKAVTVLSVNPNHGISAHGDEPGADIALHLARHGIKVEVQHSVAPAADPANELLSRAADLGTDLIVMGAYGHSRMRELALGGVTRSILEQMTVPVLMSH
jgi:nucleotide-binding universal stress UspA family protein